MLTVAVDIGNCNSNNTEEECPELPEVNLEDFTADDTCPPPCGESCDREACKNIQPCGECNDCAHYGFGDPCTALNHAILGWYINYIVLAGTNYRELLKSIPLTIFSDE